MLDCASREGGIAIADENAAALIAVGIPQSLQNVEQSKFFTSVQLLSVDVVLFRHDDEVVQRVFLWEWALPGPPKCILGNNLVDFRVGFAERTATRECVPHHLAVLLVRAGTGDTGESAAVSDTVDDECRF